MIKEAYGYLFKVFVALVAIEVFLYWLGKNATYILAGLALVVIALIIRRVFRRRW